MISCSIYLENNKHMCNLCFIETPKRGEYIRLEGVNVLYLVKDIHHDGRAYLENHLSSGNGLRDLICKPEDEIEYILRFVNK